MSADESALTITSTVPIVEVAPTLPLARRYDALPSTFQYVPHDCHFLAFITYAYAPGQYMTSGVCTRPRAVLWRVFGNDRLDFAPMMRTIGLQVNRVRADLEDDATTSGALVDFGTGGGGDFTKIGPSGGGPVGPTPGGPGGHDPSIILDYLFSAAADVEVSARAGATTPIELPGGAAVEVP